MQLVSEYYKEKVLSLDRKKRKLRELPLGVGEIKIEKDLFFWKLINGKKYIECRSEEEAQYLKVFLESGLIEAYIPKKEAYLKEILPMLLRLKSRHDEIIEDKVDGIISRRIQEQARQKIWHDIFAEIEEDILVEEELE